MPKKQAKKDRKKHHNIKVWKFYEVQGDKVALKKKTCPKCRSFLAETKDRIFCGSCGYTVFSRKAESEAK